MLQWTLKTTVKMKQKISLKETLKKEYLIHTELRVELI